MTDSPQDSSKHSASENQHQPPVDPEKTRPDPGLAGPIDDHPQPGAHADTVAFAGDGQSVDQQRVPQDAADPQHTILDQPPTDPSNQDDDAERTQVETSDAAHTILDQPPTDPSNQDDDAERTQVETSDVERTILGDDQSADPSATTADTMAFAVHADQPHSSGASHHTHFQMVDKVAQGGMGCIWRAEDAGLRRQVAYKEMLPEVVNRPELVERFVEEAQVTGQLEHPGIVPVYELGHKSDGAPYYAMKLVHGISLDDAIKQYHALPADSGDRKLAYAKLLRQFVAVCNAIGFAHMRGVLHRDLKPENIMIGDFGETLVLDWGLAKILPGNPTSPSTVDTTPVVTTASASDSATVADGVSKPGFAHDTATIDHDRPATFSQSVSTSARTAGTETLMGSVIGTPFYMSPEQAQGKHNEMEPSSDIYALGAILYEILCGQRTVAKGRLRDMLNDIIAGQIKPVRTHNASVPKSIESVAMKALQSDPLQRYQSALEMAADVEAFLADEPVSTYRDPWHVRLRRFAQKHRTLVTSSVAAVTVAVAAIWLTSFLENRRLDGVRLKVESMLRDAETALVQQQMTIQHFNRANQLLRSADTLLANEPDLDDLRADVASQLTDVTRLRAGHVANRLANLRLNIERRVVEAATLEGRDPAEARTRLTAVVTQLRQEPALARLLKTTEHKLTTVNQIITDQKAAAEARAEYAGFLKHVEDARFNGGVVGGNSVEQYARTARQQARQALQVYDLAGDKPPQLDSAHLTATEHTQIRRDAHEMLLILAECEVTLSGNQSADQRVAALENALTWLDRAHSLEVPTRVIHTLRAAYLDGLGRAAERDTELERAEQKQPQLAMDHFLLGESERKSLNYQTALIHYRAALTVDPQHFWSNQSAGLCHMKNKNWLDAVGSYTRCIGLRPEFSWNYVVRGAAFAGLNQMDDVEADFAKALQLAGDSINESHAVYLNRGTVYVDQGRLGAAQQDFDRAIELRPNHSAAYFNLGELHRKQGNAVAKSGKQIAAVAFYRRAIEHLTKAADLDPRNPNPYRVRADVLRRLDDSSAATADLEQAARLALTDENRAGDYSGLGDIAAYDSRLQEALKFYEQALVINDSDAAVHRRRAEVLVKMRRPREAIAAFSEYLEHGDPLGDVYRGRALAAAELGEYRNAMNDYTRSLELEPSPNMHVRRGWAYLTQANRLALADFEDAVRLNPQSADSYTGRGYARVLNGQIEAGVADARTSLKWARLQSRQVGPRGWPLLFNAATIFGQAVAHIERTSTDPNPKVQQQITGYTAEAVRLLEEALQLAGPALAAQVRSQMAADRALDAIRNKPAFKRLTAPSNK